MRLEGRNKTYLCLPRGMLYIVKGNVLDILEREAYNGTVEYAIHEALAAILEKAMSILVGISDM